jgi:hypothetical protein
MVGCLLYNESKWMRKEAFLAYFKVLPEIPLDGPSKSTDNFSQDTVALVSGLIRRISPEGATPGRVRRLVVFYVVLLIATSTACFDLIMSSLGRYFYVLAALYCFFFSSFF